MENKGHGFITEEIQEDNYIFGGLTKLPKIVLQEDGNWTDFLPAVELQKRNGLETMNCSVYGTLNCIEILLKRMFGIDFNGSERFVGVVAETTEEGNSPHKVAEIIRNECGIIRERLLSFDDTIDTWDKYYSPKPMTSDLLWTGKGWLEEYELKHEWVFKERATDKKERLMEVLRYSPIGVSVFAWQFDGEYHYKDPNWGDNHWVTLYGYKINKYWLIFDHYNDTFKKLRWDYNFGRAKRYYLKKILPEERRSIWQKIIDFLMNLFRW